MTPSIKWMPNKDAIDRTYPSIKWMGIKDGSIQWEHDATDGMIVSTRNIDDEHSVVEVWEFDGRESKVHHQIELPSSPLCTTWLSLFRGVDRGRGNFLAVGTMDTCIQIWDLDDINAVEPYRILGATNGHTDSVLGLALNKENRNLLASASADKQIKIWNLGTRECVSTMNNHSDKVHVVAWSELLRDMLLSGSSDRTVFLKDVRTPTDSGGCRFFLTSHVESLSWQPDDPVSFLVGLENGIVELYDIRRHQPAQSIFTLAAHHGSVTSISYNPWQNNILATGSLDGAVKLWDWDSDESNTRPTCIATKNPGVGGILSISFSPNNPSRMAIGGETGKLHICDTHILEI